MRLVTYSTAPAGPARLGVRVGHRVLDVESASRVDGEPLPNTMKALLREGRGKLSRVRALAKAAQAQAGRFSGAMHEERAIRFLPPVPDAERLLCIGRNYRGHLGDLEHAERAPTHPTAFVKLNSCFVGHNAKVARPQGVVRLDCEPELVFVVGRRAAGVLSEDALDYVVGVTILNDLTDRDLQAQEEEAGASLALARNMPGFGPLGPEIVTMDEIEDPYDLWLTCSVNGEERVRVNTGEQVWKLGEILEHFSRHLPLEPGDMFSTGEPGGVSRAAPDAEALYLKPGDVVDCSIEGLTTLRTTIVAP